MLSTKCKTMLFFISQTPYLPTDLTPVLTSCVILSKLLISLWTSYLYSGDIIVRNHPLKNNLNSSKTTLAHKFYLILNSSFIWVIVILPIFTLFCVLKLLHNDHVILCI